MKFISHTTTKTTCYQFKKIITICSDFNPQSVFQKPTTHPMAITD